jgi:hypothetical protein
MPDGTYLGGSLYSNLLASFNAKWPASVWQGQILLAAQTWAEYTNLNFAVIPDNGVPSGTGDDQQGDPGQGDIRIGGFNFGSAELGGAWFPPPANNYSAAGDLFFNTAQPFNIGSTYDLFTVATHEIGHALGLLHSDDYYAAMYGAYVGIKSYGLAPDDIAGIRSIYSAGAPRSPDTYGFSTSTFQTAPDLTAGLDPVTQTWVSGYLDITSPGQAEYFRLSAPPVTSPQLTVTVQSGGLSLLAPSLILYDGSQQPIASASGHGQYGTTISVTVGGIVPGQSFWVRVSGADTTLFGFGRYGLTVNFGAGPSPVVAPPNTTTPDGSPVSGIGGWPEGIATGQADDRGFDSFQPKPEQGAHPVPEGPTAQSLHEHGGPATTLLSLVMPYFDTVSRNPSQKSLLSTWVPLLPVDATARILSGAVFDAWAPRIAYGPSESGGGDNAVLFIDLESLEETASLANPVASLPDRDPTNVRRLSGDRANWRTACTAYFGEPIVGAHQNDLRQAKCSSIVDSPSSASSAAALAGLIVALGGYWGTHPGTSVIGKTPCTGERARKFIRPPHLSAARPRPGRPDSAGRASDFA